MAENGFQFRFQKVLDVRQGEQRSLEIELGRLDGEILKATRVRDGWTRLRGDCLDGLGQAQRASRLAEAAHHSRYLDHVRQRLVESVTAIDELRQQREAVRAELERVLRACKMLEQYRDRLVREHLSAQERADERIVDIHSVHKYVEAKRAQ